MNPLYAGVKKLSGLAIATTLMTTIAFYPNQTVKAQAAYGSYIGVGGSLGVTSDGNGNGQQIGAVIAVRYKFLEAPISLRTQAFIGAGTAVVPTISYDVPMNWQADAYVGAGMAFASGTSPSPVGDKTSFVVQPGIDYAIPNGNTVLFTNAVVAFDAYNEGGSTAIAVQGGLGLRF